MSAGKGKTKHIAEIETPCRGVSIYRTGTGAWVFHASIEADPLKDNDQWIDMVASTYPGGRESVEFLQEFRADDEAKSGERLYWAFDRERNVINPFDIPRDWPVYLGADFGQRVPTAIEFNAQDPVSKKIYVFDSIYQSKGIDVAIKQEVYKKLSRHFGVSIEEMALQGAWKWIERAVADPTAAPYIAFYAMDPWPVNFTIRPGPKMPSRHRPGESKVNAALWPSMSCCGKRQYPPDRGEPPESLPCALCGVSNTLAPVLYIFDGAAPELVQEYEDLVDKEPAFEGLEIPEVKVKAPDHASDGERYLLFDMDWGLEDGPSPDDEAELRIRKLREKPKIDRSFGDSIELLMATQQEQQERHNSMLENRGKLTASRFGRFGSIKYGSPRPEA